MVAHASCCVGHRSTGASRRPRAACAPVCRWLRPAGPSACRRPRAWMGALPSGLGRIPCRSCGRWCPLHGEVRCRGLPHAHHEHPSRRTRVHRALRIRRCAVWRRDAAGAVATCRRPPAPMRSALGCPHDMGAVGRTTWAPPQKRVRVAPMVPNCAAPQLERNTPAAYPDRPTARLRGHSTYRIRSLAAPAPT